MCLWNRQPDTKPVIITYSGKDNNETILSNYKGYVNKIYDTYRTHLSAIGKLHGCLFTALTFEQFLDKIEVVSIGQISGEHSPKSDFITRQLA